MDRAASGDRDVALAMLASLLAGTRIAAAQADLGLDPNRLFFVFYAPSGDSGDFLVQAGNRYNPIVLPCDVVRFAGDVDFHYNGAGPDVFPRLTFTMSANGAPIFVGGNPLTPSAMGGFNLITAGTVQPGVGYTPVNVDRPWLFQPGEDAARVPGRTRRGASGSLLASLVGEAANRTSGFRKAAPRTSSVNARPFLDHPVYERGHRCDQPRRGVLDQRGRGRPGETRPLTAATAIHITPLRTVHR